MVSEVILKKTPAASKDATDVKSEPTSLLAALILGAHLGLNWTIVVFSPFFVLGLVVAILVIVHRFIFVSGTLVFVDPELRWRALIILASPFAFFWAVCLLCVPVAVIITAAAHLRRRFLSSEVDS